jgi:hypothetical protein
LLGFNPERMYLTHYGRVEDVARLAVQLHRLIDVFVALARDVAAVGEGRHEALVAGLQKILLDELQAHDCRRPERRIMELLAMDIELNAQGLAMWLDKNSGDPGK